MGMNLSSTFTPAQLAAYNAAGNVLSGNLQRRVSGYDNDYLMKVLGQVGLTNDFSQADPTLLALMGQTANLPQVSSYLQQSGAAPMTNSTNNMGMSGMMNPAMMQQMMGMYGMGAPAPAPASSGFDMSSMFASMMGTNQNPMSMFSGGIPASTQSNPMMQQMMQMMGMAPPPAPAPANPMAAMMQMFGMSPPAPAPASNSPFAGLDSNTMASMFGQAPSMDPMSMMMNMMMGGGGASSSPTNMMMTMMMTMFSSFMQMIQARMQPQQPVVVEVPDPPPTQVAVKPTPKPSPKPLPKPSPPPATPTTPATDPDNSAELAALMNDLFGGSLVI